MKRYLPIIVSLIIVVVMTYVVVTEKNKQAVRYTNPMEANIGSFTKQKSCKRLPQFLKRLGISQPVMIDLSQKRFKGLAFLHGNKMEKTLHQKAWERFEYLGTYALDDKGNVFLVPNPRISIKPTTFNLQKNLYKVDSVTGKLSIFMHFDDVHPTSTNPYGLNAITYDCKSKTLWVAAIDESDYDTQRGIIYNIDPKTKKILHKIEGIDALSLNILENNKGRYLLIGSARDNALYAYSLDDTKHLSKPTRILEIPNANEHIRKIKIKGLNHLELQTIPFSYTLIAQTTKKDRLLYDARLNIVSNKWRLFTKE